MPSASNTASASSAPLAPRARVLSARYRPSKRAVRRHSNQNTRTPLRATPKRSPAAILAGVEFGLHSPSPPDRALAAGQQHRRRPSGTRRPGGRRMMTKESRTRSPSPASTTTACEPDAFDGPCPSPVVGDGHPIERPRTAPQKLPPCPDDQYWQANYEARLLHTVRVSLDQPSRPQSSSAAARRSGMALLGDEYSSTASTAHVHATFRDSDDTESTVMGENLCGMRSMPSLPVFRTQHGLRQHLAMKTWLMRGGRQGDTQTPPEKVVKVIEEKPKGLSMPSRMKHRLAGRSQKSTGALSKNVPTDDRAHEEHVAKPDSPLRGERPPGTSESWQTWEGVKRFSEQFRDPNWSEGLTRELEMTERKYFEPHPSSLSDALNKKRASHQLPPPVPSKAHGAFIVHTGPGRNQKTSPDLQHMLPAQPTVNRSAAADSGPPKARPRRNDAQDGVTPATRLVAAGESDAGHLPPIPGPRNSSRNAADILCLPVEQFRTASPSIPEDSPERNAAQVLNGRANSLKRQTGGVNLRSLSSVPPQLERPSYPMRTAASTDTLTVIEAQVNGTRKTSPYKKDLPLSESLALVLRTSTPSGDPPERPLPDLPPDYENTMAQGAGAGSHASSKSLTLPRTEMHAMRQIPRIGSLSSNLPRRTVRSEGVSGDSSSATPVSPRRYRDQATTKRLTANALSALSAPSGPFNPINPLSLARCPPPLQSPTSIYSQDSSSGPPSVSRPPTSPPRVGTSSPRAERVRLLKQRDLAASVGRHRPLHSRMSKDREDGIIVLKMEAACDQFPAVPALPSRPSSTASHGRSISRGSTSRQSLIRPPQYTPYGHNRQVGSRGSNSSARGAPDLILRHRALSPPPTPVRGLGAGVLGQSGIMVWADTNPITATFRAGIRSPSPSVGGSNPTTPVRPMVRYRDTRSSASNSSLSKLDLGIPPRTPRGDAGVTGTQTPPSSASSEASVGHEAAVDSAVHPSAVAPRGEPETSPTIMTTTSPSNSRLDVLNISREIGRIGNYMARLEADRQAQKMEIEGLKRSLAGLLRKAYWDERRKDEEVLPMLTEVRRGTGMGRPVSKVSEEDEESARSDHDGESSSTADERGWVRARDGQAGRDQYGRLTDRKAETVAPPQKRISHVTGNTRQTDPQLNAVNADRRTGSTGENMALKSGNVRRDERGLRAGWSG